MTEEANQNEQRKLPANITTPAQLAAFLTTEEILNPFLVRLVGPNIVALNTARNSIASKIEYPEGANQIMIKGEVCGVEYVNAVFNCAQSIGCACKRDSKSDSSISISHPQLMAAPVQKNPQPRHTSAPPRDSSGHPQPASKREVQQRERPHSAPAELLTVEGEQSRDQELEELERKVKENSSGFKGLKVYSYEGREYLAITFTSYEAAQKFAITISPYPVEFDEHIPGDSSFLVVVDKSDLSNWQPKSSDYQSHQTQVAAVATNASTVTVVESVPARDLELEELERKVKENSSGFKSLTRHPAQPDKSLVITFETHEAAVDFAWKLAEQECRVNFGGISKSCSFFVNKSALSSWQPKKKERSRERSYSAPAELLTVDGEQSMAPRKPSGSASDAHAHRERDPELEALARKVQENSSGFKSLEKVYSHEGHDYLVLTFNSPEAAQEFVNKFVLQGGYDNQEDCVVFHEALGSSSFLVDKSDLSNWQPKSSDSISTSTHELEALKRKVIENSSGFQELEVRSYKGQEYFVITFNSAENAKGFGNKLERVTFAPKDGRKFSVYKSVLSSWQPADKPAPKPQVQEGQSHQMEGAAPAIKPAHQLQTPIQVMEVPKPQQPAQPGQVVTATAASAPVPAVSTPTPSAAKEKTPEEKLDFLRKIGQDIKAGCDRGGKERVPWNKMGKRWFHFSDIITFFTKTPRTVIALQEKIEPFCGDPNRATYESLKEHYGEGQTDEMITNAFTAVENILDETAKEKNPYINGFWAPGRRDHYTQAAYDDWRQELNAFSAKLEETAVAASAVSATR